MQKTYMWQLHNAHTTQYLAMCLLIIEKSLSEVWILLFFGFDELTFGILEIWDQRIHLHFYLN